MYNDGGKPFASLSVVVVLTVWVSLEVCFAEDQLTPNTVLSNKSSVPTTPITCDAISTLPLNETFCVCRRSDTQTLVDLRGLGWRRKGPRLVTQDDPEYLGWLVGWSPCSNFSMYADDPLRPWAACQNTAFARFDNGTKTCYEEGSHVTSDFRVTSTKIVTIRFRNKDGKIIIVIRLVCDRSKEAAKHKFHFVKRNREYNFNVYELRSPCCCENGCTGVPQPNTSDSPDPPNYPMIGSIVGGATLLIGGALILAYHKWRKRHEYIHLPNHNDQRQPRGNLPPLPVEHEHGDPQIV